MEVIRLTLEDCQLLEIRFTEYDNSHLRFEEAITAGKHQVGSPASRAGGPARPEGADSPGEAISDDVAGSESTGTSSPESTSGRSLAQRTGTEILRRLRALRRLECHFSIDLGALYHRYLNRNAEGLHPLERSILDSIAHWHQRPGEEVELWIRVDNVRQVRELIDDERAEWLEPAGNG